MDKYTEILNNDQFSRLSLGIANHPKSLVHWEEFVNYLISRAFPLNKSIDKNLYKLIENTYDSMLSHFPYLENYYVDFALFQYRLGHVAKMHQIFQRGLVAFNQRSLHLWISYLRLCNEVIIDSKQLFKKYEMAEKFIGLHYLSGGFWDLYLDQIKERCKSKERYFIVLRKVLEIPLHSFSKYYALWLRCIDDIKDLSQLTNFASKNDLSKKLKLETSFIGRKGPYLIECKKLLKKFSKELYMVVQYQVLEIYSLFESKLVTQYYGGPEIMISASEIETWDKYLDYTINLQVGSLTHLNFQRALMALAHYEIIWLKYAHWLIDKNDLITAKNVLLRGLTFSFQKKTILRLLYSLFSKLDEHNVLLAILEQNEALNGKHFEDAGDFELFWDYIQFRIFCTNGNSKSRYLKPDSSSFVAPEILDIIMRRLCHQEKRDGQMLLLQSILQFQNRTNTKLIEEKVFRHIITSHWQYFLQKSQFWASYCRIIFLDSSSSYLERRRCIIKEIWPKAKDHVTDALSPLRDFCQAYIPEDMDTFEELFEK